MQCMQSPKKKARVAGPGPRESVDVSSIGALYQCEQGALVNIKGSIIALSAGIRTVARDKRVANVSQRVRER